MGRPPSACLRIVIICSSLNRLRFILAPCGSRHCIGPDSLLKLSSPMGSRQEDALVRIVVQKLQGILEPSVRVQEEAGIIRHFTRSLFLTVLLDGLDETRNPAAVRLAIKGWLESRLGRVSILITSSRPDFWRRCFDNAWERCVPKLGTKQGSPSTVSKQDESTESRTQGFALPRLFTDEELRAAWARSGLTQD